MSDLLYLLVVIAVGGGLLWFARGIEPHWASKDGKRCICRGQQIDHHGQVRGRERWREYRVEVLDDGDVSVRPKRVFDRSSGGRWRVVSRAADGARKRAVFVLRSRDNVDALLLVRLPRSSAAVPVLESITEAP